MIVGERIVDVPRGLGEIVEVANGIVVILYDNGACERLTYQEYRELFEGVKEQSRI